MTIQEALKANETHRVRDPKGYKWAIGELRDWPGSYSKKDVFEEWHLVQEAEVIEFEFDGTKLVQCENQGFIFGISIEGSRCKRWKVRCEEIVDV